MRPIGLLGGTSWESTADYYRLLNEGAKARLGAKHSADLVMILPADRRRLPIPALDSTSHVNALLEAALAARENSMEEGAA